MQQEVDNDEEKRYNGLKSKGYPPNTFERITSALFDVYDGMETGC